MTRTERLLHLMQLLRRQRAPVPGLALAAELQISPRTLYRDMVTLRSQGAAIEGEPGVGYVLRPGFTLPPLMLDVQELEALVLGARWVARHADAELRAAARDAIAKIASVLPADLRQTLEANTLLVANGRADDDAASRWAPPARQAIRQQRKVRLLYADAQGAASERTIWPFAIGFFDQARVLCAWCELRGDFRHFRLDRIAELHILPAASPRHRLALLRDWCAEMDVPPLI